MAITLADQYYIKALEGYDYDLEEVVENLNYALSYDQEHADANYLMGKLYLDRLQRFELAENYFVSAMAPDPTSLNTCESFSWLLIKTRRLKEAKKLIRYSYNIKGVNLPKFIRLEALVYELKKDFNKSRLLLYEAIQECYDTDFIKFLEDEIERINKKDERSNSIDYSIVG